MDEYDYEEQEQPPKPVKAPVYLPRVWKAPAEAEPTPQTPKKKKKKGEAEQTASAEGKNGKKSKEKSKDKGDGGTDKPKGVLIEETPTFDTVEARQTARVITGALIGVVFLLFVFVVYWIFGGERTPSETATDEGQIAKGAGQEQGRAEHEAVSLFNRARAAAKQGNVPLATAFLEKVVASYPKTAAGREATAALGRPSDELPDILEKSRVAAVPGPLTVATGPVTGPAPKTAPTPPPDAPASKPGSPLAIKPKASQGGTSASGTSATAPTPPAPTGPSPPTAVVLGPSPPPGSVGSSVPGAPSGVIPNDPNSRPLPVGFHKNPNVTMHASGWPLQIVCDRDGATMVLIPGGTYRVGRDDGETSEGPGHKVTLGTYYIDQTEVTVRQFEMFQKADGPRAERARALMKLQDHGSESEDAPVTMVNARDAKDYTTWAGKRLPTEAQWEVAARGGDGRLYPWGNDEPRWSKPRKYHEIDPVRSFPEDVSTFGVFDMAGNAGEWTKDWFDSRYYHQFRDKVADNPTGAAKTKAEQLTVKGNAKNWSVTHREGLRWSTRLPYLGFRGVLQVEGPGNISEPSPTPNGPANPQGVVNPNGGIAF